MCEIRRQNFQFYSSFGSEPSCVASWWQPKCIRGISNIDVMKWEWRLCVSVRSTVTRWELSIVIAYGSMKFQWSAAGLFGSLFLHENQAQSSVVTYRHRQLHQPYAAVGNFSLSKQSAYRNSYFWVLTLQSLLHRVVSSRSLSFSTIVIKRICSTRKAVSDFLRERQASGPQALECMMRVCLFTLMSRGH